MKSILYEPDEELERLSNLYGYERDDFLAKWAAQRVSKVMAKRFLEKDDLLNALCVRASSAYQAAATARKQLPRRRSFPWIHWILGGAWWALMAIKREWKASEQFSEEEEMSAENNLVFGAINLNLKFSPKKASRHGFYALCKARKSKNRREIVLAECLRVQAYISLDEEDKVSDRTSIIRGLIGKGHLQEEMHLDLQRVYKVLAEAYRYLGKPKEAEKYEQLAEDYAREHNLRDQIVKVS